MPGKATKGFMNLIIRVCCLFCLIPLVRGADPELQPPQLLTAIPVDTSPIPTDVIVERVLVRILIDQDGKPFSMQAGGSISKELADSIADWRFSPGQKAGKRTAFEVTYTIPTRQELTPGFEASLGTAWHASEQMSEWLNLAKAQDQNAIHNAATGLNKDSRDQIIHGVALLHALFAENLVEVHKAREDHLFWLIENCPQQELLGEPAALISAGDNPFADSELREKAAQKWLEEVTLHPRDFEVLDHAIHFLRFVDASKTLSLIEQAKGWPKAEEWRGHIYALQGVGITGLHPKSGKPLMHGESLPADPAAVAARETLLHSQNKKVVLSGLAAIVTGKGLMDEAARVPTGYDEFCEALHAHATTLYPGTSLSCKSAEKTPRGAVKTNNSVELIAKIKKKVQPAYPDAAKARLIQGTVELSAIINQQGEVTDLHLKSGPFALLDSAYDAVKRWQYQPAMLNGSPVSVQTKVTVIYALQR